MVLEIQIQTNLIETVEVTNLITNYSKQNFAIVINAEIL